MNTHKGAGKPSPTCHHLTPWECSGTVDRKNRAGWRGCVGVGYRLRSDTFPKCKSGLECTVTSEQLQKTTIPSLERWPGVWKRNCNSAPKQPPAASNTEAHLFILSSVSPWERALTVPTQADRALGNWAFPKAPRKVFLPSTPQGPEYKVLI